MSGPRHDGAGLRLPRCGLRMSDRRNETVQRLRSLILGADPEMVEEAKWRMASNPDGVPTFSRDGLVCSVETSLR